MWDQTIFFTVPTVVVETCYFLDVSGKCESLRWISRGGVELHDPPVSVYPEIARYIEKYADQDTILPMPPWFGWPIIQVNAGYSPSMRQISPFID